MMQSLVQFLSIITASLALTCSVFFFVYDMNRDAAISFLLYILSFSVAVILNE